MSGFYGIRHYDRGESALQNVHFILVVLLE